MRAKAITERGQVLIIFAFAAIGLFAIVGLAIDGSKKFSDMRHAQNAADTAALAAALAKTNTLTAASQKSDPTVCPSPSGSPSAACTALLNAGFDRATSNGYTGDLIHSVVEIYSPPVSGYYSTVANKDQYVQVIITSYIPTTFMRVVGVNQAKNVVQAVAFSSPGFNLTEGAMIISYDPTPTCNSGVGIGGGSVDVSGSSTLNLNGGGMFINSSIACGYNAPNCPTINITGVGAGVNSVAVSPIDNIVQQGLPSCAKPPATENFNQDPVVIPDEVYWPPVPPQCNPSYVSQSPTPLGSDPIDGRGEWLIHPGYYTDFPQNGLVANKQHIYMASGVYCINLGHNLSWSPVDFVSLNGSVESNPSKRNYNKYHAYNPDGVTLYIRGGYGFTINSNNPTFLDATNDPDSAYQGYLIILEGEQSSIEKCDITGGARVDINGLIFAPYCNITINGGSDSYAEINAQLIGWDIKIDGNNTINFNYDPFNQVKIKRKVGLMK